VAKLPKERQTLLFSATMPREIADLASHMLRDPARVAVTPVASTVERIVQRVIMTDKSAKSTLLIEVLRGEASGQTLVFTRTKHGADKVVKSLHHAGISAEAIHGNKSQSQRERVLGAFRSGKLRTLIATDIAARGIDVEGISHVINYDLPNIPESYVHRIGRTARAGADGIAISFCDNEETSFLRDIEKLIQLKLPVTEQRTAPRNDAPAPHHRPQQNAGRNGRNGNRRSGQPQRRNGNGGGHNGGGGGHAGQQQRRNEHGHQGQQRRNGQGHAPAVAASAPDNIATVAFMRQPEPRRPHAGEPNRNAR
jgi:superfamily II DNA/RNA helicase